MIMIARKTAEAILTGLFSFSAIFGAFDLINIPMDTGPKTMRHTSMIFLNCKGITSPVAMKVAMEIFTIRLMEKTDNRLFMAVNDTFNATSPFATWEKRLEVGPPGAAASNMSPTANSGDNLNPTAMK